MRCIDCIFIDVEIFREEIKSIGHHMIVYDQTKIPKNFSTKTSQLINPNLIREFDKKGHYTRKYPFGITHLLLKILKPNQPSKDVIPLLFVDGVWNTFVKYKINVFDWVEYLELEKEEWWQVLNKEPYSTTCKKVQLFIDKVNHIAKGAFGHLDLNKFDGDLLLACLKTYEEFLSWGFKKENWCIDNMILYKFNRKFTNLNNNDDCLKLWNEEPFSMSTYFQAKISYTLEKPNKLP